MSDVKFAIPGEVLNPIGYHLWSYMRDARYRLIINQGGSSSGKSYGIAQMLLIMAAVSGENALVMRKVGASIEKTVYEDFKVACEQIGAKPVFTFTDSLRRIKCVRNGARIDFAGLDDPEKIKGISNYRWVFMDEWSEFDYADFKQIRKRLRGKEGQQIITAFNPISEEHWIKRRVIDIEQWRDMPNDCVIGTDRHSPYCKVKALRLNSERSVLNPRTKEIETHAPDTVLMQTTYLDNFWVVGSPGGTYGYYDEQCVADFEKDRLNDPDYYNIYALGEWGVIRTGSEYFSAFNRGKHTMDCPYNPCLPIHVSVDNNVLPYISITLWQAYLGDNIHLRQIDEVCAGNPNNSAHLSAVLLAKRLREIGYTDKVYIHGDCTTRNANTIDDLKRSFLDLFISSLEAEGFEVVDMVSLTNPNGAMSGEFINAIWEGILPDLAITIGENCKTTIEDCMAVQKDVNGGILKTRIKDKVTGQTYEEHGHLSDTLRYVVCDIMRDAFLAYSNKRKRNTFANGAIHFFNPDADVAYKHHLLYALPNVGGRFVMVHGGKAGDKWHILYVAFVDTDSVTEIKERLTEVGCQVNVFECPPAYYPLVRELRSQTTLTIKVTKESTDIDRRIAATSDYVKSNILFRDTDDAEYNSFVNSLLDYNKDGQSKEASAVLSGFVMYALKSFSD